MKAAAAGIFVLATASLSILAAWQTYGRVVGDEDGTSGLRNLRSLLETDALQHADYNHSASISHEHRHLDGGTNGLCPIGRETLEQYTIQPVAELAEVSYMVHSAQKYQGQDVLWMGSDKRQNEIHAVSLNTGNILQTYKLWVHHRGDWESIALGPCSSKSEDNTTCLYIQDAGDNSSQRCSSRYCEGNGERNNLYIFKFPEPDLSQLDDYDGSSIRVVIIRYNYKDSSWPTNHADSEAMFVDWTGDTSEGGGQKGDIYIMTKQPYDRKDQRIGKVPVEDHENLTPKTSSKSHNHFVSVKAVAQASVRVPWSGVDMSRDGTLIAARRESMVYFFARDVQMGQTVEDAMSSPPCQFISKTDTNGEHRKQSEAVAFLGSKYSFAETSECYQKQECLLPVPSFRLVFPS